MVNTPDLAACQLQADVWNGNAEAPRPGRPPSSAQEAPTSFQAEAALILFVSV